MKSIRKAVASACLALLLAGTASAQDYFPNYERVRPLGMGGAFTAVADSEDAAFYNPAGLNNLAEGRVTVLNPTVEFSKTAIDTINDYNDVDTDNEVQIADFLKKHIGEPTHFRFQWTPGYARKNFALYALANANVDARVRDRANPVADVVGVGDAGGQISGAYGFNNGMVQVGATLRVIHRWSVARSFTARDFLDNTFSFDNEAKTGTGVGGDLGVIVHLPYRFSPAIGIAVKDVASPKIGEALKNKQDVRFGVSAKQAFNIGTLRVAADVRRIGQNEDFWKKVYLGAEFAFPKYLSLRTGLYQGYLSAGASLDLWILKVAYATYAAEVGAFPGQVADRRHTAQFELGF
jgi:hypothetical protein